MRHGDSYALKSAPDGHSRGSTERLVDQLPHFRSGDGKKMPCFSRKATHKKKRKTKTGKLFGEYKSFVSLQICFKQITGTHQTWTGLLEAPASVLVLPGGQHKTQIPHGFHHLFVASGLQTRHPPSQKKRAALHLAQMPSSRHRRPGAGTPRGPECQRKLITLGQTIKPSWQTTRAPTGKPKPGKTNQQNHVQASRSTFG